MTTIQKIISIGILIIACSVAYYYLVTLPSIERGKLEIEKSKLAAMEVERAVEEIRLKAKQAADETRKMERHTEHLHCRAEAEKARNEFLQMNGIPTAKQGVYRLSPEKSELADQIERQGIADCFRMYGEE